jgi:triosephosphate isomerase
MPERLIDTGTPAAPKNIDLKGTVNSLRAARQRSKNNPPVRSGGSIAKPELRESCAASDGPLTARSIIDIGR